MAKYLIVAREAMYNGFHGLEDWTIEELPNVQEAFALAREMSLDLIDSYSELYNIFKENAEYWADSIEEEDGPMTAEQRENYIIQAIEDQREEDVEYCIWRLSPRFDYSEIIFEFDTWQEVADLYGEEEY